MKHKIASNALTEYRRRIADIAKSSGSPGLKTHILPCPLQNIRSSPDIEKYRNKDEFFVYSGVDGNPKTVGFLTGHPKLETTVCVPPTQLITLKDSHKAVCSHFERFIRSSKHPSCLHFQDSCGVWRSIVVRSTRSGELLAAVIIHPHTLQQEEITEIEEQLRDYFFSGLGQEVGLTSLYLQVCPNSHCSRDTAPYKLLEGAPYITETCLGLSFRIKPDTFFQVNTSAAEQLYAVVQEVGELSPLTTVVDIGCGSGSISLLLAGRVRGTLGIEVAEAAVEDANDNAAANALNNASFIPGPPDKVLPLLCRELTGCTDVVAVVNPGRGGLHPRVIETIRATHGINKLIYLSNRPQGYALANFVSLAHCKPGTKIAKFPSMVPSFAFSVDTLPHTPHFDMGILFVKQEMQTSFDFS